MVSHLVLLPLSSSTPGGMRLFFLLLLYCIVLNIHLYLLGINV